VLAPICHSCQLGDFGRGFDNLVKGGKYCLYGCLTSMVGPVDGCINCVLYNIKNCKSGVSGAKDITENCKFISREIEKCLDSKGSNEPDSTFKSYSP
jgi:hypothetical protein